MGSALLVPFEEKAGWGGFLSSLRCAEQAAADQCDFIADRLCRMGGADLAHTYHLIGQEEREHIALVRDLCRTPIDLPPRAQAVYQGKFLSAQPSLVERMAVFHLAFEASALSFLGYLCPRVEEHFGDQGWARQIRSTFTGILRQEVGHVSHGKEMVLNLLAAADEPTRQEVSRSLRRHHTFLSVGLKSFFKGLEDAPFIREMLEKFHRHFRHATQGVLTLPGGAV